MAPERLGQVAIAVTGWVGKDGRGAVSHRVPEWEGVDVAGHLASLLGCPVRLGNDVNLAALGEQCSASSCGSGDMLYLLAGSQISAGLVLDGKLRLGEHGAAGEMSGVSLPPALQEAQRDGWRVSGGLGDIGCRSSG